MKLGLILLLAALFVSIWLLPSFAVVLCLVITTLSLAMAIMVVFRTHRIAYLEGRLTRSAFTRTLFLDIAGILLAMTLAVLLGWYIAELATKQVHHALLKQTAGIVIGLSLGTGVGFLLRKAWRYVVKTSPES